MYISQDISERIKCVAKNNNIPLKKLFSDVGLGFNTMANMKHSMPKADSLAKIADYLGCSVDYLLGRTDDPGQFADDKKKPIPFMGSANPGSAVLIAKGGDGQQLVAAPRPELLELYEIAVGLNNQHMSVLLGLAKDLKSLEENGK